MSASAMPASFKKWLSCTRRSLYFSTYRILISLFQSFRRSIGNQGRDAFGERGDSARRVEAYGFRDDCAVSYEKIRIAEDLAAVVNHAAGRIHAHVASAERMGRNQVLEFSPERRDMWLAARGG